MAERDDLFDYTSSKLESLGKKLAQLKAQLNDYEAVIEESTDIDIKKSYQLRKDRLFDDIDQVEQDIRKTKTLQRQQFAQAEVRSLIEILTADSDYLDDMQRAYGAMASHWPLSVPAVSIEPGDETYVTNLLSELQRLGDSGSGYSAVESFVANLVHLSNHSDLLAALNQWGSRGQSWNELYDEIDMTVTERIKHFKPAVLIKVNLSEEAPTQSDNQRYCRLEAWLIEDLETYQKQQTGYHSLVVAETQLAKPFPLDELESKLQPLLAQWLEAKTQLLEHCQNDPEFYVFLPIELLALAVDAWTLDKGDSPKRLGHLGPVILCCLDRFEGDVYPVEDWHTAWAQHEACLTRKAEEVFIGGSHQDIDTFLDALDALDEEETDQPIVGWKVDTALDSSDVEACFVELKEFFEELLFLGVPLAFWGRCNESNINNAKELDKLLRASPLGQLPRAVKKRRLRDRSRSPSCHIGHHLSLLRDNPSLRFPIQCPKRA